MAPDYGKLTPKERQEKATETFDALIKQRMEKDGIPYQDAFLKVAKERPKLHALWSNKRGIK